MAISNSQIKALSDALANSGHGKTGLVKSGSSWGAEDRRGNPVGESHSNRTVQSLVDRGMLRIYVGGTVAHITDSGSETLEIFLSSH